MASAARRLTTDAQVRASVVRSTRKAVRDQLQPKVDALTQSVDRFVAGAERLAKADRTIRALDYLRRPDAETRAIRDRAVFLDGTRQEAERQRQSLADQQKRADAFYGRAGR